MKFFAACCTLLALVVGSSRAGPCDDLNAFTGNIYGCLAIVVGAELDSLTPTAIDNYCRQINSGALCMDSLIDGCKSSFPADAYNEMKSETTRLISDYADICKELKELSTEDFDKRTLHTKRTTSAVHKLLSLHPLQ